MRKIIDVKIVEVLPYACWGTTNGDTVFIHVMELSYRAPIPDESIPKVGDVIQAAVINEATPEEAARLDISQDGKYRVRYFASVAAIEHPEGRPPSA